MISNIAATNSIHLGDFFVTFCMFRAGRGFLLHLKSKLNCLDAKLPTKGFYIFDFTGKNYPFLKIGKSCKILQRKESFKEEDDFVFVTPK